MGVIFHASEFFTLTTYHDYENKFKVFVCVTEYILEKNNNNNVNNNFLSLDLKKIISELTHHS